MTQTKFGNRLHRRVGKKVNGALTEGFLYDGQLRPVAWLNGAGQVYATFVYGLHVNIPEYMTTSAGTFRILTDHGGSPRLVVNTTSGAVAQRQDYDSFGQVLADTNPGFQPFGFAGGLYDRCPLEPEYEWCGPEFPATLSGSSWTHLPR
jgi:hypothetical protein